MIIGVLGDTHQDKAKAVLKIVEIFKKHGVSLIVHTGDITRAQLDPGLFGNIPVICALVGDQVNDMAFQFPPKGWVFTKPGDRIVRISEDLSIYVGHKLAFEFLAGSEEALRKKLAEIRMAHDGVRWLFTGHTHHQILSQSNLISFVNPGAVEDSVNDFEYAIVNTDTDEVVFSRVLNAEPITSQFCIGVISDTLDVSRMNPKFWAALAEQLKGRGATHIIHCGNIYPADIGRKELADFEIFYYLREDQIPAKDIPANWHQIPIGKPVVEINGYKFYVQLDLGTALLSQSEMDMERFCNELRRQHPEISFALGGFTQQAFLEEGLKVTIVNPGGADSGHFATIALPTEEIAFATT